MPTLVQGMPPASRCVFRESFRSLREVMDNRGAVVAATVDRGINPTGASGRVTFQGTEALLINSSQATWKVRFRTASVQNATTRYLLTRWLTGDTNGQFAIGFLANHMPFIQVANALNDAGVNYFRTNAGLVTSSEYTLHGVYNGALAVGSRMVLYLGGAPTASTGAGTLPTSMMSSSTPLAVFQKSGGSTLAPDNDFKLLEFTISSFAMSAEEVADDAANLTYSEVF